MTARSGMANLILRLRAMGDAGTADYVLGGVTYFSDDYLQSLLDRHREDFYREPLQTVAEYNNSNEAEYYNYYWQAGNAEEAASGTVVWQVENSLGSAIGTADYTAYYDAQYLRFTGDTEGTAYYLTYRAYDLDRAASELWKQKAASVASRAFDISTDNHSLKRSQLRQSYLDMANFYTSQAKPRTVVLERSDT